MSLQEFNDRLRAARDTSNAIAKGSFKIGMIIIASMFVTLWTLAGSVTPTVSRSAVWKTSRNFLVLD
jgi:hypothetical protein